MNTHLPTIIDPQELELHLDKPNLLIVDLSQKSNYDKYHIPGAVHLEYSKLTRMDRPVMGLVPDIIELNRVFSEIGLNKETQVVTYDDEGGGKAGRLIWTLDLVGHPAASLLNGGIFSWANEGHPMSHELTTVTSSKTDYLFDDSALATKQYIKDNLSNEHVKLLDTRSPEEFSGIKVFANHGGHIPGAVNMDWILAMDQSNNLRLQQDDILNKLLESKDIQKDKQIIVYCQTHHRSSHTYVVLKHLGYSDIKGYPGAWSDWGNSEDTPKEM